jgi:hypothetical protein
MGMTAVASMYGSCTFSGHDYVLNTIRVDTGNIPTLISPQQCLNWRLVKEIVGYMKKKRKKYVYVRRPLTVPLTRSVLMKGL